MNIKSRNKGSKVFYVLTGYDTENEVAAFPGFLQACLVARYISGGSMPEADQENALAAIAEFDDLVDAGCLHFENGGALWE